MEAVWNCSAAMKAHACQAAASIRKRARGGGAAPVPSSRSRRMRSHTGLSPMPTRMKIASSAGAMPMKNSERQPYRGTSSAWTPAAAKKPHS